MSGFVPVGKNAAAGAILYIGLVDQTNTKLLKSTPTLAAGDFKISIDGAALANLTTLPTVTPAAGRQVKVTLSQAEVNGDNITIQCVDAAGAEWCDLLINIQTATRQLDDHAFPATSGRSIVVDAAGLVDANVVKLGPTGAGTAQTARDIGTSVLLTASETSIVRSSTATAGTATTLTLDGAASAVDSYYNGSVLQWTSGVNIGVMRVITSYVGATKVATFPLSLPSAADAAPTFVVRAQRAAIPGTDGKIVISTDAQDLSASLSVNAKNIAGVAAASATIGTVTTLTNLPAITANWLTAAGIAADAITDAKVAADVTIASVTGSVGSVTGAVGSVTGAVGSVTGNVGGNVVGSVASVTGNVGGNVVGSVASVTAAVAITSNLKTNQAFANFEFLMTDSTTHAPATGKVVTVTRSIDGGAFAVGTLSAVTELSNGIYLVSFGAGDLNGKNINLRGTAAACDDAFLSLVTQP